MRDQYRAMAPWPRRTRGRRISAPWGLFRVMDLGTIQLSAITATETIRYVCRVSRVTAPRSAQLKAIVDRDVSLGVIPPRSEADVRARATE